MFNRTVYSFTTARSDRFLYGFVLTHHNAFSHMDRVKRIWYLSPMRAAKVQASRRIRAVSPEPPLLAHISSESRGTFRQKARSLAPLNGWACAVKICHDGMLEDTNLLDRAHISLCMLVVLTSTGITSRRKDGAGHIAHSSPVSTFSLFTVFFILKSKEWSGAVIFDCATA